MPLVVETGTGAANAESYVSVENAAIYAAARGLTFPASPLAPAEQALRRATAWIDATYRGRFPGTKMNGRSQALEWPRSDAEDRNCDEIPSDEVPVEIVNATVEAAVREMASPGSLSPDYVASERVKREKVGSLEVEYSDKEQGVQDAIPVVTVIDGILGTLFSTSRTSLFGKVARA